LKSLTPGSARPIVPRPHWRSLDSFITRNINKGPFVAIHLLVFAVFLVPLMWSALALCAASYFVRMFAITAGFHRYFSHRAYKTSRWFQFVLAWLGCSATQKGPLWWSANHRSHHKHSDTENDPHSPVRHGVFWSHIGWVLFQPQNSADLSQVKDLAKHRELRLLEWLHWLPPLCLAVTCYLLCGWSGVVWGYVVSTVLLYHGSFLVNSVCHIFGKRRYETSDASRNNALVALVTLGEGWHNNHHHYQSSANQGFRWWEIDISYYGLYLLKQFGLVWDLRKPPANKLTPTAAR
jgi:stearoyl-CoA desaturase (Delta-9 desaturase)